MPRPKRAARKRTLTELYIRKVKPEKNRVLIWDLKQHGLVLVVEPTGMRAWKCIYSFHGRPRWLHIGKASAIGLADARKIAAELMLQVIKGKDPAAERKAERGAGTFADLAARYVEEYAKSNNKSWEQGDGLVRRYALPRWGKLQAATIARADVKALIRRIAAPVLANQVLASVSAIFTWAVPSNPCKLVARNPVKSRERVLSESEIPKFWLAFGEAGLPGAALKALLLLGQRPGEIAHMRREHIKDGWWEMPGDPVPSLEGVKDSGFRGGA